MSDFLGELTGELEEARREVEVEAERVADAILSAAQDLVSRKGVLKSETELGVKTGRLRRSLKKRTVRNLDGEYQVEVYFDEKIAPHAKFVIQGTRKIKPHPILEAAAVKVENEDVSGSD